MKRIFTIEEVAELCGVERGIVKLWIDTGRLTDSTHHTFQNQSWVAVPVIHREHLLPFLESNWKAGTFSAALQKLDGEAENVVKALPRVSEHVGMTDMNGDLVLASDWHSQIEGTEFDGPILWDDAETAENDLCDFGGLPEDHMLVKVTLTISNLD